jgi:hypothetical protein
MGIDLSRTLLVGEKKFMPKKLNSSKKVQVFAENSRKIILRRIKWL